jgi:hypothetical protein
MVDLVDNLQVEQELPEAVVTQLVQLQFLQTADQQEAPKTANPVQVVVVVQQQEAIALASMLIHLLFTVVEPVV